VQNLNVTAAASAGIQLLESTIGTVSGCSLSNFVNHDGSVQGYSYILSSLINTQNCKSTNFQSHYQGKTKTLGHTVLGFVPILCVALKYENCTATNMTGCCDDCHGMSVFLDAFIEVIKYSANNIIDGITKSNSGAKATGLEVYGVEVTVKDSSAENIKAINPQDLQAAGFSAAGTIIKFINCKAKNVIVTDKKANENPDLGYGVGYGWAPDPRIEFRIWNAHDVTYKDCSATSCQVGFEHGDIPIPFGKMLAIQTVALTYLFNQMER